MRTTLTLDEDLALQLEEVARESKTSFKSVVNATLRRGLASTRPELPFVVKSEPGYLRPGIDDRSFNELAFELDDHS